MVGRDNPDQLEADNSKSKGRFPPTRHSVHRGGFGGCRDRDTRLYNCLVHAVTSAEVNVAEIHRFSRVETLVNIVSGN